ncbi:MAG: hypothetical protein C0606_01185 [Hyphomicrobiales bacterium]|nr:MAG: hypothetical protein C0606_01185 [Hyphomicrobiales bacterium]
MPGAQMHNEKNGASHASTGAADPEKMERLEKRRAEQFEHAAATTRQTIAFAFKTLLVMNAGALVVMLAFLGHLFGSDNSRMPLPDTSQLRPGVQWFLCGIVCALLALSATYANAVIAQHAAMDEVPRNAEEWNKGKPRRDWQDISLVAGLVLALMSGVCLVSGIWSVADVLAPTTGTTTLFEKSSR